MELSVIIPVYNAATTIAGQLASLACQQWNEPWEVIIADNGSLDQSLSIAQLYRHRIPNLRVVDASALRGAAYARNVGASLATGKVLAFCDADDEVAPGWIAAMGEALSKHNWVAGRVDCKKLNDSWLLNTRVALPNCQEYHNEGFHTVASCNLGISRLLHESIGGFDECLPLSATCDDDDYSFRLQLAGAKVYFAHDALVYYRFRHTLRGLYKQAKSYGKGEALMYMKYASIVDLPKPASRRWVEILADLILRTSRRSDLARLLCEVGRKTGRLDPAENTML
jgi:glycosyltransferase involved in cell wall biosynthesis